MKDWSNSDFPKKTLNYTKVYHIHDTPNSAQAKKSVNLANQAAKTYFIAYKADTLTGKKRQKCTKNRLFQV